MINGIDSTHPNYALTIASVQLVRDALEGEPVIKSPLKLLTYLPNTVSVSIPKKEREAIYELYAMRAEYDNIPANTLESLIGAITRQKNTYEGIDRMLLDDVDGDGLSMDELIKITCSELLAVRYCGFLAEHTDLASLGFDTNRLLIDTAKKLNLRPSIKQYARESIVNWDFKRINGVLQLAYVVLKEQERVALTGSLETENITSYLLLALDENGDYFQQRYTENTIANGGKTWSDKVFPTSTTGMFKYIPFEFCKLGDYPKGVIPKDCGYIYRIATKAVYRYQINADMKQVLWYNGAPITYSTGWDSQSFEQYKEMTGLDYIDSSPAAHIPLPTGSTVGQLDWKAETSAYFVYLDKNAREIEALGGIFDTERQSGDETATGRAIDAAEETGVLSNLLTNVEKTLTRMVQYASMFRGVESTPKITINREFTAMKLSPQERGAITNERDAGLITDQEALRQLKRGGALVGSVEDIINERLLTGQ
jgi:hypothetical protein